MTKVHMNQNMQLPPYTNHRQSRYLVEALLGLCLLTLTGTLSAAVTATTVTQASGTTRVIPFAQARKPGVLRSLAPNDEIELSNGVRLRVSELRKLSSKAGEMHAHARSRMPKALRLKPATTGRQVRNAGDLEQAIKQANDSETLVLPSGRHVTVGLVRMVQPQVEKRLGRKLSSLPIRSGPLLKVTEHSDWKEILQKSDNTVLQTPGGTRITVGELKQALQESDSSTLPQTPRSSR